MLTRLQKLHVILLDGVMALAARNDDDNCYVEWRMKISIIFCGLLVIWWSSPLPLVAATK